MNKIFTIIIAGLFVVNLHAQNRESEVIRLSEPVETTDSYEVFGSKIKADAKPIALSEVITNSAEYIEKEILVTASVKQVCAKKGCFFIAQSGDKTARITFVDYSFFIPTDAGGKEVTIQGVFNEKELTEQQARHYAEDAKQDTEHIKGPQKEYSIVATAVVIPK